MVKGFTRVALLGVFALVTAGCSNWLQVGYDASRSSFNANEKSLTSDKLDELDYFWFEHGLDSAGPPVMADKRMFVVSDDEDTVTAFNAVTGAILWQKQIANPGPGSLTLGDPTLYKGGLLVPFVVGPPTAGASLGGYRQFDVATGDEGPVSQIPDLEPWGFVNRGSEAAHSFTIEEPDGFYTIMASGSLTESLGNLTLLAKSEIPMSTSAPMILGNRAFVTAGATLFSVRLDQCTPSPLVAHLCAPEWSVAMGADASFWAPTPVGVGADKVAVGLESGVVRVFDATAGTIAWETDYNAGQVGGIAVARGVLYAGNEDGVLRAYNVNGCGQLTCDPIWDAPSPGGQQLTAPVVAADVVYVSGVDASLHAFNANGCGAATCSEVWSAEVGGDLIWPIVVNGRLFVTSDEGDVAGLRTFPQG